MNRHMSTLLIAAVLIPAAWSTADVVEPQTVRYALQPGSSYQHGCFEGCACPIIDPAAMTGTFDLTTVQDFPEYQVFEVSEIAWDVADLNLTITGSGTYTRFSEFVVQQSLELELQINGEEPQAFDSGWVVTTPDFPQIHASVNMNDLFCYDVLLVIEAAPTCDYDTSGDGMVNAVELANLLGQWGPCSDCAADYNHDQHIDAGDLAMLLGAWGPCP